MARCRTRSCRLPSSATSADTRAHYACRYRVRGVRPGRVPGAMRVGRAGFLAGLIGGEPRQAERGGKPVAPSRYPATGRTSIRAFQRMPGSESTSIARSSSVNTVIMAGTLGTICHRSV
jgi:hypothetical protein